MRSHPCVVNSSVFAHGCEDMTTIIEGFHPETDSSISIKVFPLHTNARDAFKKEIRVQELIRGNEQYFIKVIETTADTNYGFISMKKYECTLHEYAMEFSTSERLIRECEARKFFRQICKGIAVLHQLNIAHLNLKLQNILVESDLRSVVIGDFSKAKISSEELQSVRVRSSICHSDENNAFQEDIYDLGIMLFYLLTNKFPSIDPETEICVLGTPAKNLSQSCQNLLRSMLNPSKRPSIFEVLQHPWLKGKGRTFSFPSLRKKIN